MKPKEYVKKYKMNQGKFHHNSFIVDFTIDFMSLIEFHYNANWNLTKFNNCVKDMRSKWDGISNRIAGGLPEKLWKYFYATVVVKTKEEYCGAEVAARKGFNEGFDPFSFLFGNFLNDLFNDTQMMIPLDSFQILGIGQDSTSEDIKKKYKELAFQHHPDKGGNEVTFRKIVEAKNRCLAYLL